MARALFERAAKYHGDNEGDGLAALNRIAADILARVHRLEAAYHLAVEADVKGESSTLTATRNKSQAAVLVDSGATTRALQTDARITNNVFNKGRVFPVLLFFQRKTQPTRIMSSVLLSLAPQFARPLRPRQTRRSGQCGLFL